MTSTQKKQRTRRWAGLLVALVLLVGIAVAIATSANAATYTALGDREIGEVVYIEETVDGYTNLVPYIVVEHDYITTGNTILLRQYLFATPNSEEDTTGTEFETYFDDDYSDGSNYNEYKGGNADTWLTETFQTSYLDSYITPYLVTLDLPYTSGCSSYTKSTIERSVFLPSAIELGYSSSISYLNADGSSKWAYFTSTKTSASTKDTQLYAQYGITEAGSSGGWWSRSPVAGANTYNGAWYVPYSGTSAYLGNAGTGGDYSCGVRPALSLASYLLTSSGDNPQVLAYTIKTQPSATEVKNGETATFTTAVNAGNGIGPSYQWYYNTTDSNSSGTKVDSGGTSASLSVSTTDDMDGRYYYCEITDGYTTLTTDAVMLTVYYTHSITTQPTAQTVLSGEVASFSVIAEGGNPTSYTYQWYQADGITATGSIIDGAAGATYNRTTVDDDNGLYIYCIVANGQYEVTSNRVLLSVKWAPRKAVVTCTSDEIIADSYAIFKVDVTDLGSPDSYTYQWYKGGVAVSGANQDSYYHLVLSTDNNLVIYCVVTNTVGSVKSNVYTLAVQSSGSGSAGNSTAVASHPAIAARDASNIPIDSGVWSNSEIYFTFGASIDDDAMLMFEYSLDEGKTWITSAGTAVYAAETGSAGTELQMRAYNAYADASGKSATLSDTVTYIIKIDRTAPTFQITIQNIA